MYQVFESVAVDGVIRLPSDVPASAHCLVTVLSEDKASLQAQAELLIPEAKQRRMSELLLQNKTGSLSAEEISELDALSVEFDAATLARGRALAALARTGDPESSS